MINYQLFQKFKESGKYEINHLISKLVFIKKKNLTSILTAPLTDMPKLPCNEEGLTQGSLNVFK